MNSEQNDRAGDNVPPAEGGGLTGDGASQPGGHAPPVLPIDVADSLILRLNAVAYSLASCARVIDEQAAARIGQAIADLDQVIEDLRVSEEGSIS
jgi:hypothetical protein